MSIFSTITILGVVANKDFHIIPSCNIIPVIPMSQCPGVLVSQCPGAPVSQYPGAPVSMRPGISILVSPKPGGGQTKHSKKWGR